MSNTDVRGFDVKLEGGIGAERRDKEDSEDDWYAPGFAFEGDTELETFCLGGAASGAVSDSDNSMPVFSFADFASSRT